MLTFNRHSENPVVIVPTKLGSADTPVGGAGWGKLLFAASHSWEHVWVKIYLYQGICGT